MCPIFRALLGVLAVTSVTFFVLGGGLSQVATSVHRAGVATYTGATWFVASVTKRDLARSYESASTTYERVSDTNTEPFAKRKKNVRILIVPGHEPFSGGAEFGGIYEREWTYAIGESLREILSMNPRYEVMLARTDTAWHPALLSYFTDEAADIEAFREAHKEEMDALVRDGSIPPDLHEVHHGTASTDAALHLYGINKWAGEQNIDIALHLHLNDYADRKSTRAGEHAGFSIYVPLGAYSNGEASKDIADAIAARLSAYHATSTLAQEASGVVESRPLIATGAYNTADHASVLIEYGYIYEPQFHAPELRDLVAAEYAYQTYLGLQDFFGDSVSGTYGSVAFPYDWQGAIGKERGVPVYALQAALHHLGFYPPKNVSFTDCPITGVIGPCTKNALSAYQQARSLSVSGVLDGATAEALQNEFGVRL